MRLHYKACALSALKTGEFNMKKIIYIATMASLALASSPALAGGTVPPGQGVPEPSAFSLIAGTAVAIFIASRFIRRK